MSDKNKAPLYEALVVHARRKTGAFHVPGHKQRAAWGNEGENAFYEQLLALDVTELSDTDDLHHPQGPIAEAQKLAAMCFGAEETQFLVGGSTAGNLAMILGVCGPGDLLLVQRNVHKSIIHGLMLAGVRAVMLPPEIDAVSGLALSLHPQLVESALAQYSDAKALIISTPNYYGLMRSIEPLAGLAHQYGIPLLVDEAHGPHFGFHPHFPKSALQAGADIVVQSTHKMLSAMTMGAMLHMQGKLIDRASVRQALQMVQSSSPSFPILASLDLARRQLHTQGAKTFVVALAGVERVSSTLMDTPFRALGYGNYAGSAIQYDPLKMVLFDETGTLDGFELRDRLEQRKCVAEMADARYVVMAFGTGSSVEDGEMLASALHDIGQEIRSNSDLITSKSPKDSAVDLSTAEPISLPEPVTFQRNMPTLRSIPLEDCAGFIAGEWVIPYPPGIPLLYPGESITQTAVEQLKQWRQKSAHIQGANDSSLQQLQVYER
ncbi:hypothetical protein SD71_16355 [Cohnella kolymensis]|uniref:Amino acid decarboxylase n=1 Tax=Cohnella kolymensis TaxID=1590652 RepID=A0ABR5A1J4_9BACL|nr:aminotransferase class I/II-fold pyridoxal phosphate-dependent enzyme [Cohnella kolymensis]KIL34933.1 hypothetical protein SD71_16355 [Cohnella kolymensis]